MREFVRKKKKSDWKIFFCSFSISFSLFLFIAGMLVVDYTGRKMVFADDTPIIRVTEEQGHQIAACNLFGIKKTAEITEFVNIWKKICDFCCIPNN